MPVGVFGTATRITRPCLLLLLIGLVSLAGEAPQQFPSFHNVAEEAGISFRHENGASPEKYLPETLTGGGLILDYDSDGWPDVFLVNGGSFVDEDVAARAQHQLYRNNHDGTFTEVDGSGIGISGFGMGACAADYDNDGHVDLYLTSVSANKLYRNGGSGRFVDVTADAGVGSELFSSSCAFADVDNDGDVDLYVANYVDFSVDDNRYCGNLESVRIYCHPNAYNPLADVLYRNNGDGTFSDVSRVSGVSLPAYGLGVVFSDYDDDGWVDIYVANDSQLNFLFRNKGNGVFEELGLSTGVAVGSDGEPQAGMGTDMADMNADGRVDAFVTNLDRETHSLYANLGDGVFADVTFSSGVGTATIPFVGFGTAFFDYDNDADLDIVIGNGGIFDNPDLFRDTTSYPQPNLLLQNDGRGRFEDVSPSSGAGFQLKKVSRAVAVGDLDNDGDLDILVSNNGQTADLLRNEGGNGNNSILIRTIGEESNRDGIGARLLASVGDQTHVREVKAGSSYLGQNDLRIHFGLGQALEVDRLEIRWPSGTVEVLEGLEANRILTVVEGRGITDEKPFER